MKKRIIVGISGASGAPIAIALMQQLKQYKDTIEIHLIVTSGGEKTIPLETECTLEQVRQLADVVYEKDDLCAGPASGTFPTIGMVVVPCSMKTLAGIVSGYSDNLLLRAADVTLKERRKLILVTREAPLGTLHLENMVKASTLGALILPPVISFYNHPQSIEDCINHIVGKILDQFHISSEKFHRWQEDLL